MQDRGTGKLTPLSYAIDDLERDKIRTGVGFFEHLVRSLSLCLSPTVLRVHVVNYIYFKCGLNAN